MPEAHASIHHVQSDTLPRVLADPEASGTVDLLMPFKISTEEAGLRAVSWRFDVTVDGVPRSIRSFTRRIRAGYTTELRDGMRRSGEFSFDYLPYYLELDDEAIRSGRATYLEGRVPGLTGGAAVEYRMVVTLRRASGEQFDLVSERYLVHAVHPRFDAEEIRRTYLPAAGRSEDGWILYHRRREGRDEFRVDVLDLRYGWVAPERAPLAVTIGGTVLDLTAPDPALTPLIDVAADSVSWAVPVTDPGALPPVTVRYRGGEPQQVDLSRRVDVGETRFMLVNFAIQGLNDFFATADDDYPDPATYVQVTMRDPEASFSSRPGSRERDAGDGYAFTLDAHRRYGIPQLWAMNGGLLGLLAHDCPADLATMSKDIADGLLVPVVAGYGAHRIPYYRKDTNLDAIRYGAKLMANLLGTATSGGEGIVYYPDSRITTNTPNVTDALREGGVEYLVVDAGGHEGPDPLTPIVADPVPQLGAMSPDGRWISWQYVWRDRASGTKVLFIDREAKDRLLGCTPGEADRGTVDFNLRRKFFELAAQPTVRAGNLVVYSDDADKASGNGWFDGVYGGGEELQFNQRYQAALSWLAAHPWVRVVTTADLGDADCVGELDLVRASDPFIEEAWRLDVPLEQDFGLAFDTWYAEWARTRVAWLGENLRAISDRAEAAIDATRADGTCEDELVVLARLYLSMCLHESQWSKRARIEAGRPHAGDPEDFVIAESIQLRNLHVYLAANLWARWARSAPGDAAYRDSGPVVEAVAAAAPAGAAWVRQGCAGLQWDHDPLPNVVLYNASALVVLDRNGGRITHLFTLVDGRPVSVSGTHKAYQSLDLDWAANTGVECDGIVLQNTVFTPNHSYVAGDPQASRGNHGESPSGEAVFAWYYPDNFNLYDEVVDAAAPGAHGPSVTFEYGEGTWQDAPTTIAGLEAALEQDRDAKLRGERGVIVHDTARFGRFRKTIRLDGRTVHISYSGTRPGHRVANEFCVDLLASTLHGCRQQAGVEGPVGEVRNDAGLAVRLELGAGCEFGGSTGGPLTPPTVESLRLHRVMTDNLELVAPQGGDFDYRILLPGG